MNTPDRATARATAAKMISRRKRDSGVSYRRCLRIELQDQAQAYARQETRSLRESVRPKQHVSNRDYEEDR
jgi:hypothetical protein